MGDMELLSIGLINDMYAESRNDECKYAEMANQEDMDRFQMIDNTVFLCYNGWQKTVDNILKTKGFY